MFSNPPHYQYYDVHIDSELGPCTDLTTSLDGPIQKKILSKGKPKGQSSLNHISVIFIAYKTIHFALYVM